MREHEVPTHVQAEDRVLLWFTFPQIVAMTAVCALSYGAYRYAPIGPSELRIAIAVLLGLVGLVAVVGKIGGRSAAAGGRRPAELQAGRQAPQGAGVQPGEERAARAGSAGGRPGSGAA